MDYSRDHMVASIAIHTQNAVAACEIMADVDELGEAEFNSASMEHYRVRRSKDGELILTLTPPTRHDGIMQGTLTNQ